MPSKQKSFFNWGRNTMITPKQVQPKNLLDLKKATNKKSFIITGNQRSFGDVALNNKLIISMKNFQYEKIYLLLHRLVSCALYDTTKKFLYNSHIIKTSLERKCINLSYL